MKNCVTSLVPHSEHLPLILIVHKNGMMLISHQETCTLGVVSCVAEESLNSFHATNCSMRRVWCYLWMWGLRRWLLFSEGAEKNSLKPPWDLETTLCSQNGAIRKRLVSCQLVEKSSDQWEGRKGVEVLLIPVVLENVWLLPLNLETVRLSSKVRMWALRQTGLLWGNSKVSTVGCRCLEESTL